MVKRLNRRTEFLVSDGQGWYLLKYFRDQQVTEWTHSPKLARKFDHDQVGKVVEELSSVFEKTGLSVVAFVKGGQR